MIDLTGLKIVIAGGSGFLGTSMARQFVSAGAEVTILSRNQPQVRGPWAHATWDARTVGDWCQSLDGAHALVNLTGRSVNCIKSPDHQDEILRSRVESTRVLGQALRQCLSPPPVWGQMSTAHIYGDPPAVICTDESETGVGFAPEVGRAWERAFADSILPGQRGVVLRTSFVVGRDQGAGGGALATLKLIARLGLGGRVGQGTQGISWIHETDLNRVVAQAITDPSMSGVYVAS
ncbi:MAG TPA: NAD-dependent epimerase/dehydratase family protein [Pirellulaceae bacterium]|nr:NAD-dependent epimerase/dehydratase family protein [Pirellulaceae bacterium]